MVRGTFSRGGGSRADEQLDIQEGEDIGIIDFDLPTLGTGVFRPQSAAEAIGSVIAGAVLSEVATGTGRSGVPVSAPPDEENDAPIFPEGSIFAPGQVWGDRDPDFPIPETPPENDRPVEILIPLDASGGDELEQKDEEDMATIWDYVSPVIDVFQGQQPGGGVGLPAAVSVAGPGAGYVGAGSTAGSAGLRYNSKGQLVNTCKRRRRRRLLTEGDFNDLMRIATLPNKQNVTVALAKAVGRR